MTLLALCSAKGSPGVTTLACILGAVWPPERSVIVAECDPSGGDLAVRFGLSGRSGIASYLFAARDESAPGGPVIDHCQQLPGGLEVLVGALGMDAAGALDRELAVGALGGRNGWGTEFDVLADCGRLLQDAPGQQRILSSADCVILVSRPDAAGIAHARLALDRLRRSVDYLDVRVAIIGTGPFQVKEIRSVLGVDALLEVPADSAGAEVAGGRPGDRRAFGRSTLVAQTRKIASDLARMPSRLVDMEPA